jgi:hypothetical protein
MANPTNPFNWQMPTATDLVTDLPADFEVFGQAVATSMADLLGGTTGQVLSKASNTNMDFTWVTTDDANAIQNSIVDAKGDLIAASAADTPARLAVGNNGETLVADSSTSTGLRYQGSQSAGRNRILNSDFSCWQRGTSFTNAASLAYTTDRFFLSYNGTGGANTVSRIAGPAIVGTGVEAQQYFRYAQTTAGSGFAYNVIAQRIENVSTLAGQTVTVSFYAKADSAWALSEIGFEQDFGAGGSSPVYTGMTPQTLSTSWARYSFNATLPSITGKTIGTSNSLRLYIGMKLNSTFTFDIYGVQVEAGSVATAFQTATGTIQGELSACQRYYWREIGPVNQTYPIAYQANSTTFGGNNPVVMRVSPSVSTTYQNANYTTAWYLVQPTRTTTTKTGSVAFNFFSTPQTWAICIDGGTFSPSPSAFQGGSPNYFEASAEL